MCARAHGRATSRPAHARPMPTVNPGPKRPSRKGPQQVRRDAPHGNPEPASVQGRGAPPRRTGVRRTRPTRSPWWRRHLTWLVSAGVLVSLAVAGVAIGLAATNSSQPSSSAPSASLLASTDNEPSGAPVDGIQSNSMEQVLFHIHAHLAVNVNGSPRTIPEGIGITPPRQEQQTSSGPFVVGGSGYYWLHTHTADGIIHIESPVQRTYTLGNFFDIWGQPLSSTQVGPAHGTVIAYVNGQRFSGDPRSIPLTAHAVVQLDVGSDVAPQPFDFPAGL